jgi:hypothetical protein
MSWTEIFQSIAAVLASFGGASLIVVALMKWLGDRYLSHVTEKLKAEHSRELTRLAAELKKGADQELARLQVELDKQKAISLGTRSDKIAVYRAAIDVVAELLAEFDQGRIGDAAPKELIYRVNRSRVRAFAYMGMMAPQSVMDAYSSMEMHLLDILVKRVPYDWIEVRRRGLTFLNAIRKDIQSEAPDISYAGEDVYRSR